MGGVVIYHKLKGEGYSLRTSQKADFFHAATKRLANGRQNSVNETKFFSNIKIHISLILKGIRLSLICSSFYLFKASTFKS